MKIDIKKILRVAGSFLLALLLVYCFMLLVDTQYDRRVGDWFEAKFTELCRYEYPAGQSYIIPRINWIAIKNFAIVLCGAAVVLWLATVYITMWLSRRSIEKKIIHDASQYLKVYLSSDTENEPLPRKRYKELVAGVSDFKSKMLHNERALKDETSKKNDLIAYLAHDLKTPLTSVVGYLSLLEEAPDMPEEQKARYTHTALQKSERLEQLINEFFEITRYNLHEIVLEKETIDLNYMLIQMSDEFYPVLRKHRNKITIQAQEGLQIYADPIKIARVFNNILKNAIAYSEPDSAITITAEKQDDYVHICFINRGKTIPQQKLQTIFEKFYRLDEARSTNSGGAGLGLAIAKEIVRHHGGTISASSENKVTTFHVMLPTEEEE